MRVAICAGDAGRTRDARGFDMHDAKLLRSRLMGLITSGGALAVSVAACGGTVAPQNPDATAPAPTTTTPPPGAVPPSTPADAGPRALDGGPFKCEYGKATELCFTREQLQAGSSYQRCFGGGPYLDAGSPPTTAYNADGCVDPSYVCDGCCNRSQTPPRVVGDKCCYSVCTGACCG